MLPERNNLNDSHRIGIIKAVKTYLNFYVLVILITEVVLGGIALSTSGTIKFVAVYLMASIIIALIVVITLFAYKKPEVLLKSMTADQKMGDFSKAVVGKWWQRITPNDPCALSYMSISPDPMINSVRITGDSYNSKGDKSAHWETIATCINPNRSKIFYYWEGRKPKSRGRWGGFGEILFEGFDDSIGQFNSGSGIFSDRNLGEIQSTNEFWTEYQRCTDKEIKDMTGSDGKGRVKLIRDKLN